MREILFRGKTFDGEWEEGSLHIEYGETTADEKRNLDYRILGMRGECRYVDPETVGQFTGLCDKNGKKIFDGDIACFCDENRPPCYCVIKYGEYSLGHIGFYTDWYKGRSKLKCFRKDLGFWVKYRELEVIGNIHDNPELLEG